MTAASRTRDLLYRLDGRGLGGLYGRSLLLTQDWELAEIELLGDVAELMELLDRAQVPTPLFPNELHLALFFDSSTRTRSSWAGAASRLGARPVMVDGYSTQVVHGESARETGTMLGMNAHALGIRHDLILGEGQPFMRQAKEGVDLYLEALGSHRAVPVVNLQSDVDHPTQILADWLWLRERFPEGLEGKTVAVSWAFSPSYAKPLSVPQGLLSLLTRVGMHVRLARPEGYDLTSAALEVAEKNTVASGGSLSITDSMDEAFADADVVYPKSWGPYALMLERKKAGLEGDNQKMRETEQQALDQNRKHQEWICNEERIAKTKNGGALYMHCLPADIDAEVSPAVMDRYRIELARQANKKLYVIMALLAATKEPDLFQSLRELM